MRSHKVTIRLKHMVCPRCIKVVTDELTALGLKVINVSLGEATYLESPKVSKKVIVNRLQKQGFELVRDPDEELVEEIRRAIIELIHHPAGKSSQETLYSEYLPKKVGKSYSYLSSIFSKHSGITIEKYAILQKIEKAKELIEYGELTFAGIAYELGYKSAQHLANQFKTVTGMSMSDYKKLPKSKRKHLDSI